MIDNIANVLKIIVTIQSLWWVLGEVGCSRIASSTISQQYNNNKDIGIVVDY